MTLLIVDDSAPMRRFLISLVSDLADNVYECADGRQAVACYKAERPDWVLMDIEMPIKDGITATRQITADFPRARVIIVTVHDNALMRREAQAAGACAFVPKANLMVVRQILLDQQMP